MFNPSGPKRWLKDIYILIIGYVESVSLEELIKGASFLF